MRIKITLILIVVFLLSILTFVFAQDQANVTQAPPAATIYEEPRNMPTMESVAQWIWGEVISADIQKSQIRLKYLEYDTDQEKELTLTVDDKTTYENVKALSEIGPQDTLSVDYAIKDGKNIAKNINVEKAQNTPVEQEDIAAQDSQEAPALGE